MDADQIFREATSGLNPNPTDAELKESINAWIGEFKAHVLEDMDGLIECDRGTERETMWRELRSRYAAELDEVEKEIRTSN